MPTRPSYAAFRKKNRGTEKVYMKNRSNDKPKSKLDSAAQAAVPAEKVSPAGLRIPLPAVMMGLGLLAGGVHTDAQAVAVNDSYSTPVNTVLSGQNVTANDTRDGNSYSVALVTNVAHGTLALQSTGVFSYTPNTGFSGTDAFSYALFDFGGSVPNSVAQVSISVVPPQPIPTLGTAAAAGLGAAIALIGMRRRRRK
jgi:hypothetical protein